MRKIETVFFDLDGTLVDNYEAITKCISVSLEPMGITPPTLEKVKHTVGGSILITFEKLIGKNLAPQAAKTYMEHIKDYELLGLKEMPHAREILQGLKSRGIKSALFTNKSQKSAENIIEFLNLSRFFEKIIGTDLHGARKPEKEFTLLALEKMNADFETSAVVGDSPYDYKAAKACGLMPILVATGGNSFKSLESLCPGANIFKDLREAEIFIESR